MRRAAFLAALPLLAACFSEREPPAPAAFDGNIGSGGAGQGAATSSVATTTATTTTGTGAGGGAGGGTPAPVDVLGCACISDYANDLDCEACFLSTNQQDCVIDFTSCSDDPDCSVAVDLCVPACPPLDEACIAACLAIPAASRARAIDYFDCACGACTLFCGGGAGGAGQGGASSCQ